MFIPPHTGLTFRPSRNLKTKMTPEERARRRRGDDRDDR
jgi:hypothetical protein